MSQAFAVFDLSKRKGLFKDERSFDDFVADLRKVTAEPETTVLVIKDKYTGMRPETEALCGLMSIEATHEIFRELVTQKLENPHVTNSIVEFLSKPEQS